MEEIRTLWNHIINLRDGQRDSGDLNGERARYTSTRELMMKDLKNYLYFAK